MADLQWRLTTELGWLSNCASSGEMCGTFTTNPKAAPSETKQVQTNVGTLWLAARRSAEEDMRQHTIPRTMGFGDYMTGEHIPSGSPEFHKERNTNMADRETCIKLELTFMDIVVEAAALISDWTLKRAATAAEESESISDETKKGNSTKPNHWFNGKVLAGPWKIDFTRAITNGFFVGQSWDKANDIQLE